MKELYFPGLLLPISVFLFTNMKVHELYDLTMDADSVEIIDLTVESESESNSESENSDSSSSDSEIDSNAESVSDVDTAELFSLDDDFLQRSFFFLVLLRPL